jgi:hypothetical protein
VENTHKTYPGIRVIGEKPAPSSIVVDYVIEYRDNWSRKRFPITGFTQMVHGNEKEYYYEFWNGNV